jgi:rhomboid family protein
MAGKMYFMEKKLQVGRVFRGVVTTKRSFKLSCGLFAVKTTTIQVAAYLWAAEYEFRQITNFQLSRMFISDVVKNLLIINVLMYLGTQLMGEPNTVLMNDLVSGRVVDFNSWGRYKLAVFYPASEFFKPYQVVTYMFMHGNLSHIFFNMFALYMFGSPVEMAWGPKKFLFFYFFTGFGALVLQMVVQYIEFQQGAPGWHANVPMLGASGAVFGILAAYGMQFPNSIIQLIIPPIKMKAKYFVIIYAAIEIGLGLSPFQTGVAHFAHVGGALFGVLLILYWRSRGERLY